MNRLLAIGFQPAGHWLLEQTGLTFGLTRHATQRNILYAFVCDGQVKYVGKTVQPLAKRMAGYKNPGIGQSTNINNNRRIRDLLATGAAVEILALPDNGLMHYGQFHLNLAAALEDSIIGQIDPEWNGGRRELSLATASPATVDSTAECEIQRPTDSSTTLGESCESARPTCGTSFTFTLQPTYHRTGFFNVGVSSQSALGADGETIEIFLGNSDTPLLGAINRRANKNNTPRVMGGVGLRDWFVKESAVGSSIEVLVHSPNAIRVRSVEKK
jgi:hypothetical protein